MKRTAQQVAMAPHKPGVVRATKWNSAGKVIAAGDVSSLAEARAFLDSLDAEGNPLPAAARPIIREKCFYCAGTGTTEAHIAASGRCPQCNGHGYTLIEAERRGTYRQATPSQQQQGKAPEAPAMSPTALDISRQMIVAGNNERAKLAGRVAELEAALATIIAEAGPRAGLEAEESGTINKMAYAARAALAKAGS